MNFLAHLYLSGNNPELMIGNFIADSVKGNAYNNYPPEIAKGILLHRAIDDYTDKHPVFLQSVNRIREHHGKYSGVIADIFYDHILAGNWKNYSDTHLHLFAEGVYTLIAKNEHLLPEKTKMFFSYMVKYNWLVAYSSTQGIAKVLQGMSRRASFENSMDKSVLILEQHYSDFESEFVSFFGDMQKFVGGYITQR